MNFLQLLLTLQQKKIDHIKGYCNGYPAVLFHSAQGKMKLIYRTHSSGMVELQEGSKEFDTALTLFK
jgi:hypothetical protein